MSAICLLFLYNSKKHRSGPVLSLFWDWVMVRYSMFEKEREKLFQMLSICFHCKALKYRSQAPRGVLF